MSRPSPVARVGGMRFRQSGLSSKRPRKGSYIKRPWTMAWIEGRVGAGDGGDAESAALTCSINGRTNGPA